MLGYIVFLLLALRASALLCLDCVDSDVVRLSNAADPCTGVVLVTINYLEGTICDLNWDMNDAAVVCRQLGCGVPTSAPRGSVFGVPPNRFPRISNVGCRGDESSVFKCSYSSNPDTSCANKRDASVQCTGPDQVWLVNGPSLCAGRVSIVHNGVWGKVCDDSWDQKDASVVCRQLGCGAVQSYQYNSAFGNSPSPVLMSNVQCQGDESALWKCAQRGWNFNTCPTGRNAGVTCAGGADAVRLVNSGDACSGRVEIKHANHWGTVCNNQWDMKDAEVVCRQLNCGSATKAQTINAIYRNGVLPVWMSDVRCTGAETSLFDCPHGSWEFNSCTERSDAGVQCSVRRAFNPTVFRASLSVDPKAADATLLISSDGKDVRSFDRERCVRGATGVISGKWYWQVNTDTVVSVPDASLQQDHWRLGVASASVNTAVLVPNVPQQGFWVLTQGLTEYTVTDETNRVYRNPGRIYKVGIFVDYEEGLVSFYNADGQQHIYTHTATFKEKIYPYICLGYGRRTSLQ
ncbi:CD5 antigen-like [Lissotriton helveticus]